MSISILRREFSEPDRAEVQERTAHAVEADPEPFLRAYIVNPDSFQGRFVNSDLMKETFPDYNASPQHRNRYNAPVHNSAAVLAAEQYRRAVLDVSDPLRDTAIMLTGIPGAGKTTSVLIRGDLAVNTRVVFEGQLADAAQAIPKIDLAIASKLTVEIAVVHLPPELALANTLGRFASLGRGASIEAMARIQSGLPNGLRAIHEHFGAAVSLRILDRSDTLTVEHFGWDELPRIAQEGTYEQIKQRLRNALDGARASGLISESAYDQAIGHVPRDFDR